MNKVYYQCQVEGYNTNISWPGPVPRHGDVIAVSCLSGHNLEGHVQVLIVRKIVHSVQLNIVDERMKVEVTTIIQTDRVVPK